MIKAEQSAAWNRTCRRQVAQMYYLPILAMRPEAGGIFGATNHAHAEHLLVEHDRPVDIRYLQSDPAQTRRFRKPIPTRPNAVPGLRCGHLSDSSLSPPRPERLHHCEYQQDDQNRLGG